MGNVRSDGECSQRNVRSSFSRERHYRLGSRGLPERLQCPSPRDKLIQHRVDRSFLLWTWLEDSEAFEVGKHGEQDLVAQPPCCSTRQTENRSRS